MAEYKIINDAVIPQIITSAYIDYVPFDVGKEALEKGGYPEIISLEYNARLRMSEGKNAFISRKGNCVREGLLWVPKESRYFLTKRSPIIKNPNEATNMNRCGLEYELTNEQVEMALEDSVKILEVNIPTKRFEEYPETMFAFGHFAEDYGLFLADVGIENIPICLQSPHDKHKAWIRQVWFDSLDREKSSAIYTTSKCTLHYLKCMRGARILGKTI